MASIYKIESRKCFYISFIDPDTNKKVKRCTDISIKDIAKAKLLKNKMEDFIQKRKEFFIENKFSNNTISAAIKKFMQRNKNEKTLHGYKRFFEVFCESYSPYAVCSIITKDNVDDWISSLDELTWKDDETRLISDNTKYNHVKVLNKFLKFLFEYGYVNDFTVNRDICPKPELKKVKIFLEDDLNLILNGLDLHGKTDNFQFTILMLLYTGLRPSDIVNINAEDIIRKDGVNILNYFSKKTIEYRQVPLNNAASKIIEERIVKVRKGKLVGYSSIDEISKAFSRYLRKLGLNGKGYNLRTFRKHFITLATESGIEPNMLAQLVGHKNINTTHKHYSAPRINSMSIALNRINFG